MRTQLFRKVAAIAGWGLLAGVLTANAPSFGDEPTPSAPSASCQSNRCAASVIPMLARLPYLNRIFKNQPVAEAGDVCICVDGVHERIGIDFDLTNAPTTKQPGERFEFEFTTPTTSRLGVQVAEFAGPITESCRPRVFVFAPSDKMQRGPCPSGAASMCGTCPSACEESSPGCEFACPSDSQPIDFEFEIVDSDVEFIEALAETQIAHLQEKHHLQLEIVRLQAKLEFQTEREKLQGEITDLRHENTALQLQLVFSQKATEAQQELATARAEVLRLTQRSSELEAQLLTPRPTNPMTEPANVAKQPTTIERR